VIRKLSSMSPTISPNLFSGAAKLEIFSPTCGRAVYLYPGSRKPIRKLCRLGSTEEELLKALDLEIEAVR
jgi:hypothetical protein